MSQSGKRSNFTADLKDFVINQLRNPETSMSGRDRSSSVRSSNNSETDSFIIRKQTREAQKYASPESSPILKPKGLEVETGMLIESSPTPQPKGTTVFNEKDPQLQGLGFSNSQHKNIANSEQAKTDLETDDIKNFAPESHYEEEYNKSNKVTRNANDHELELLTNMVLLPFHLEKIMIFSLLGCFNLFLYYFTMIPLRFVYLCCEFFKIISKNTYRNFSKKKAQHTGERTSRSSSAKNTEEIVSFLQVFRMDFILLTEQVITCAVLISYLDTSRAYHKIKGQNGIKLYALFGVLEMTDKMLSTIGQDFLLSIYRRISNSTILFDNKTNIPSIYFILLIVGRWVYLMIHSTVLVYQTIALNVAVNSYSNTLGTLLLSMQFGELKSSVFKKFDKEGLFQLTIADVVERFQLISMLAIISMRNIVTNKNSFNVLSPMPQSWYLSFTILSKYTTGVIGVLCGPMLKVIGSELIVDWLKHAYIGRFNRFKPDVYDRVFRKILIQDSTKHTNFKLQARLGVPIQAQVVTFTVLVLPKTNKLFRKKSVSQRLLIICAIWLFLLSIKIFMQLLIKKWCIKITNKEKEDEKLKSHYKQHNETTAKTSPFYVPGELNGAQGIVDESMRRIIHNDSAVLPPSAAELRLKKDAKDQKSLERVERYKMSSKKIW